MRGVEIAYHSIGAGQARGNELFVNILKHWFNSLRHSHRWPISRRRDEVGHAGEDDRVRLGSDRPEALCEDLQGAAGDHLSTLHGRTSTACRLRDVATNVGTAKKGEDSNLGHLYSIAERQQTHHIGEETEIVKSQQQGFLTMLRCQIILCYFSLYVKL